MTAFRLTVAVALAVLWPAAANAGERVALVVGVSDYRNIQTLENPANDARAVARALQSVQFSVTTLDQPAQVTREGIARALVEFRRKAEIAEAAIVYFAGHGVEVNGANWLLPADVSARSPDELEVMAIQSSAAINAVRGASTIRLVILDACRDNPFAAQPGFAAGTRNIGSRGLAREKERADNVVVLMATQPGARANDGRGTGNSPFARALAAALTTEDAQIGEIPALVSSKMRESDGIEQRPDQQGIFDASRWMFKSARVPAPRPSPIQDGVSPAVAALIRECDRLAGSEFDPDRPADSPFVRPEQIVPMLAISACTKALEAAPGNARMMAQIGRAHSKAEDYSAARQWYEQAAARGNSGAMNNLAAFYHNATGVTQDNAKARLYYEQAAGKGNVAALSNLGVMYEHGQGVTRDYNAARRYYERAAGLGFREAMRALGRLFETGTGVEKDFATARGWYEQAASRGDLDGMVSLGGLYEKGNGVAQDFAQARRWYELAEARGHTGAMTHLGFLYEKGNGVAQDFAQARSWYERAASKGEPGAMNSLGNLYKDGKGVSQDYAQARRWYEQAAAKGFEYAMFNLAELYYFGRGVTLDYAVARTWYEQAAKKDHTAATINLGYAFEKGQGGVQDLTRARVLYERAAAQGSAMAMSNLGNLYANGKGVAVDMIQARRWYEQAAAQGYPNALRWLADHPQ